MATKGVSAIVPVYNAQCSIPELHKRLTEVLCYLGTEFEIIFADDCSTDNSWEVICSLAAQDARCRGVHMSRNYGQHNVLLCGIRLAEFDTIVTLDDDLQNPPEEIPKLLSRLTDGVAVVYGTPEQRQHGILRNVASQVTKLALQSAMGARTARKVSAYRAFRTELRNSFRSYAGPFVSIDVLLTWATTRFTAVAVRQDPRTAGKSNYTTRKLLTHALNMMTGFSAVPLRFASFVGFFFSAFGVCVFVYVVARYFISGSPVPGFPFLASAMAIFCGAQLFALGILGEYLARMHFRLMDKPPYYFDRTTPSLKSSEHASAL